MIQNNYSCIYIQVLKGWIHKIGSSFGKRMEVPAMLSSIVDIVEIDYWYCAKPEYVANK